MSDPSRNILGDFCEVLDVRSEALVVVQTNVKWEPIGHLRINWNFIIMMNCIVKCFSDSSVSGLESNVESRETSIPIKLNPTKLRLLPIISIF